MYHCLALSVLAALVGQAPDDRFFEILKDAQAANASSFPSGRLKAETSLKSGGKREARVEATLLWNESDAFWIYKMSDPDGILTGRRARAAPLEQAPIEYALLYKQRFSIFNPDIKSLFIYSAGPTSTDPIPRLLKLGPTMGWYDYCPPIAIQPWSQMIGRDPARTRGGLTVTIERLDGDLVRQRAVTNDGNRTDIEFSLANCGNVTSFRTVNKGPGVRSRSGEYEWAKTPDGRCFLRRCETRASKRGLPSTVDEVYTLKVTSFETAVDVSSVALSDAALKQYLPADTQVIDAIKNTTYPLNPSLAKPLGGVEDLARELRVRGFLKK